MIHWGHRGRDERVGAVSRNHWSVAIAILCIEVGDGRSVVVMRDNFIVALVFIQVPPQVIIDGTGISNSRSS